MEEKTTYKIVFTLHLSHFPSKVLRWKIQLIQPNALILWLNTFILLQTVWLIFLPLLLFQLTQV